MWVLVNWKCNMYTELGQLKPALGKIFREFYDHLLSDTKFSVFFQSEEQVQNLLNRQQMNFIDSLTETKEKLFQRYYRLGVIHFDLGIPFEAIIVGQKIMSRNFFEYIVKESFDPQLVIMTNSYFEYTSEALAKGYLDSYLEDDKKDIERILSVIGDGENSLTDDIYTSHYSWLQRLFIAIRSEDIEKAPELEMENADMYQALMKRLDQSGGTLGSYTKEEIQNIHQRIFNKAKNMFYFIERKSYTEALTLFLSLLEIYKFFLLLGHMVSALAAKEASVIITEQNKLLELDSLTGVYNRRKFDEIFAYGIKVSHKKKSPFSLIIFDLDHFKKINDTYGHAVGDDILREVGRAARNLIDEQDVLARYGGEEFVIVCFETNLMNAVKLAEKLRMEIGNFPMTDDLHVSISAGVAEMHEEDTQIDLFRRADHELYRAKKMGRNRVCHAE